MIFRVAHGRISRRIFLLRIIGEIMPAWRKMCRDFAGSRAIACKGQTDIKEDYIVRGRRTGMRGESYVKERF